MEVLGDGEDDKENEDNILQKQSNQTKNLTDVVFVKIIREHGEWRRIIGKITKARNESQEKSIIAKNKTSSRIAMWNLFD